MHHIDVYKRVSLVPLWQGLSAFVAGLILAFVAGAFVTRAFVAGFSLV
jgi:hypothetical protein